MKRLVKELGSQNPDSMFHAMAELAKMTCNNLRNTYILSLVEALLDRGLGDSDPSASAGASVALNSVLKVKGGYLPNHVPHILGEPEDVSNANVPWWHQISAGTCHTSS
ncbi:hypothetical protein J437_LFUL006616 [Ladona fulva]|uniref:Maestro-like HEAT-repeats domain-containing protein n=1 Tax=Ladona fulva TaxID=123851 RepID=A0A8K0P8P0_LADFU|nr:hypothetical protein J437_LFUL006616 [Ladona fulva]